MAAWLLARCDATQDLPLLRSARSLPLRTFSHFVVLVSLATTIMCVVCPCCNVPRFWGTRQVLGTRQVWGMGGSASEIGVRVGLGFILGFRVQVRGSSTWRRPTPLPSLLERSLGCLEATPEDHDSESSESRQI
jgi:hypothetical protein